MEALIDKINKSIYKDANKKTVIHGKIVRDAFLEKDNTIEYLKSALKSSTQVNKIIHSMLNARNLEIEELKLTLSQQLK
jgi:hypothetical protein